MYRRAFIALLLVFSVSIFFYARGCKSSTVEKKQPAPASIFQDRGNDMEEEDEEIEEEDIISIYDCPLVCSKLTECGITDAPSECEMTCRKDFSYDIRECIVQADCEKIGPECLGEAIPDCDALCEKLVDCGITDELTCEDECPFFESETVECVQKWSCPYLGPQCFGWDSTDQLCQRFCNKLFDCEYWEPEDMEGCLDYCYEESLDLVQCVIGTGCEDLQESCFENQEDSLCDIFCDKLLFCGTIEDLDMEICVAQCALEAVDSINCAIDVTCPELESCFDTQEQGALDCGLFCDKLTQCGLIAQRQYDPCLAECEMTAEERIACVIEVSCSEIVGVCY